MKTFVWNGQIINTYSQNPSKNNDILNRIVIPVCTARSISLIVVSGGTMQESSEVIFKNNNLSLRITTYL